VPDVLRTLVWTSLAPSLAARNVMRVWRGAERGYDQVRKLATATVPVLPAAVPLYTRDGWTRVLGLDFDTKTYGEERVVADAADAVALIAEAGGRVVVDRSPAGGRHVWVPLWAAHRLETVRPVLRAMQARWPTLDIAPMSNPAAGCLTPPGSACPDGGVRELVTPLDLAIDAVAHRSALGTLGALGRLLGTAGTDSRTRQPALVPPPRPASGPVRTDVLAADVHRFAVTGKIPADRPGWTRSEARMSVLVHAVRAGIDLADICELVDSGSWAGLAAAYAKHGLRRRERLRTEWVKAQALVAAQKPQLSEHKHHITGGVSPQQSWLAQTLRWISTTPSLHGGLRTSASAVAQAVAWISLLCGGDTVAPGGRWLSIAAGMLSESTVWSTLKLLSTGDGAPLRLVNAHHGPHADRYELTPPHINGQLVDIHHKDLTRARVHRVPAVWQIIGHGARETFELIDMATDTVGGHVRKRHIKDIATASASSIDAAIARLAEFGLIEVGWGWVRRTSRSLSDVAADHDVARRVADRLTRHRAQRRAWWELLALWDAAPATDCPDLDKLPDDPLTAEEHDCWLHAVMSTGPPVDPFEPSLRERPLVRAIDLFCLHLGALPTGPVPAVRHERLPAIIRPVISAAAGGR
jgi:hypothetical protein